MGRVMLTLMLLSVICSLSPLASAQQQSDRQFVVYFRDGHASLTRDACALVDRVAAVARASSGTDRTDRRQ